MGFQYFITIPEFIFLLLTFTTMNNMFVIWFCINHKITLVNDLEIVYPHTIINVNVKFEISITIFHSFDDFLPKTGFK